MNNAVFNTKNWLRLICVLAIIPFLVQCREDNPFGLSLAVNSDTIRLDTAAGETHIMVYSDGDWKVSFKEDSETDWISVDRSGGHGNGEIVFSYSKNYSASRSVTLILTKGGEHKDIVIVQEGIDVDLHFTSSKVTIPKQALPIDLPVLTAIRGDYKSVNIEYLYDDETMEKWITNDTLTKEGYSFEALENNSGRDRAVRVYLSVYDADGNEHSTFVDITQTLESAFLKSKYQSTTALTKAIQIDTVILDGNVGAAFPAMDISVTYDQGSDWIEDVSLAKDSLLIIAVRENNSGENRNADIHLDLTIDGQNFVSMTHHILQSKSEYEQLDFQGVRNMITSSAGTLTINAPLKAIEGIVISNTGNPNMETNPHVSFSSIDMDETYKTAYIESLDGKYGFRLKFRTQDENTLVRYSKVSILLNGLTLEKEADPDRYTIAGLKGSDIVGNETGNASDLVVKEKYIADITDEDVYTYITLKDVSLSVPYGTYVNVNHGYVVKSDWNQKGRPLTGVYADAIPTAIYDSKGDDINVLVNAAAPMAINTKNKNSGTISGIVTHSKLLRFGGDEGDIGKYQIRPLNEDDIQLDQSPVATTLVEWNWLSGGTAICSAGSGGESAFVGTGFISCTALGASQSLGNDYLCNNPDSKTPYKTAFQYTGVKWWNAAEQRGEGFVLHFSTAGISAQYLLLNFSIQSGGGNDSKNKIPTYWQIEYSTDGTNYVGLPNSTFAVRPVVQWATNRPYEAVGLMPYTFKLPNNLLGKSNVFVKIVAQSNVYAEGSPDGADQGRLTGSEEGSVRLGNVSVKYIQ